jgi:AcrR family transcriptional regulator
MDYEVTKRINGHDYIYSVEGYRDPKTGQRKKLWRYVGPLANSEVQLALRTRPERVTRDEIIEATARLMEHRDPSHITISVIVSRAKTSSSTFYRHFPNRDSVVNAAIGRIRDEIIEAAPRLDIPPRSLDEARQRLRQWYDAILGSALKQRGLRWARALSQSDPGRLHAQIQRAPGTIDSVALLARFFNETHNAGFAIIEDPVTLARAISGTMAALYIALVAQSNEIDLARPLFADFFPLIERAVFGERAF